MVDKEITRDIHEKDTVERQERVERRRREEAKKRKKRTGGGEQRRQEEQKSENTMKRRAVDTKEQGHRKSDTPNKIRTAERETKKKRGEMSWTKRRTQLRNKM